MVGIPYEVALVAVLTLAVAVLALFLLLVLQREVANLTAAYSRAREVALTPLVHRALRDPAAIRDVTRALRRFDRPVLREMLVHLAVDLRGEESLAIAALYEDTGLLEAELARLSGWGPSRRASAAANLGTLRIPAALPALLRALEDRDRLVRLSVVQALGELGVERALAALVPMLGDPSPPVARRAGEILADQGRDVADEILAYLGATGSRRGRLTAVELLGWLRAPRAADRLLDLVSSLDPELRIKAVKAAAAIGDPRFLDVFHRLLDDPAWEVRCHAAKGLGLLGSPASVPHLRARLGDRQWWVRYHAAVALAELGPAGRAALDEARADPEPRVVDMARYILERVGSPAPVVP